MTAFTDRPDRDAAVIPIGLLVKAWPELFASSPPNAVLAAEDVNGDSTSLVVTLTDPKLDGTTATFIIEIVDTKKHRSDRAGLAGLAGAPATTPPPAFGAANLFIDDVETVYACINPELEVYNPPGYLNLNAGSSAFSSFQKQCTGVGGHVAVTEIWE